MKRILAVGYFGFGNLGDEACLEAFKNKVGGDRIDVLRLSGRQGASFSDLSRLNGIKDYLAVVFVGGNLLQNKTSKKSLYFYLSVIRAAKRQGVPVCFISSGIGEIYGSRDARATEKALGRVTFFGARTASDLKKSQSAKASHIMPDLCFLHSVEAAARRDTVVYIPKDKSCLDLFLRTHRELGARAVIVPTFYSADISLCKRLCSAHKIPMFIPNGYQDLLALLSGAAISFCERLHGAVFSLLSLTPAVISDTQEKCRDFFGEVSERAARLNIKIPIYQQGELPDTSLLKKELGAKSSEFEKILVSFKADLERGFRELFNTLGEN